MLLGLGLGFSVNIGLQDGRPYELAATTVLILSLAGLLLALIYSLVYVVLNRFKINRPYAISLMAIYGALVIVDVAVEIAGIN